MQLRINENNNRDIDKEVTKAFTKWLKDFTTDTDEDTRAKELFIKGYISISEMIDTILKNHVTKI